MLNHAFVIVNKETGRYEIRLEILLYPLKLNRACNPVSRATTQLTLVVYRRTLVAEIDARGERCQDGGRRRVQLVPLVRYVAEPAIMLNCISHYNLLFCITLCTFMNGWGSA